MTGPDKLADKPDALCVDARPLTGEAYARAEREFLRLSAEPDSATPTPRSADDVRNLSPEEFERRLTAFLSENSE